MAKICSAKADVRKANTGAWIISLGWANQSGSRSHSQPWARLQLKTREGARTETARRGCHCYRGQDDSSSHLNMVLLYGPSFPSQLYPQRKENTHPPRHVDGFTAAFFITGKGWGQLRGLMDTESVFYKHLMAHYPGTKSATFWSVFHMTDKN